MALMFFHIPRTGGSTVWHSLAGVAARQNKIVADLYHQSREITGHPFAPQEAIQFFHDFLKQTNLCFDSDVIYHHHTYQHDPYLLGSDELQRVALIRDPATRLVSEAFHMRRFLLGDHENIAAGQPPSQEYEFHRKLYSEELFRELIASEVDPDALVLHFARHHQNYYLSYFSGFLHPELVEGVTDEAGALGVAREVGQAFMWVGQFPALGEFLQACGLLADLDISIEQDMQHVANGSSIPVLKEETLAQVRAINSLDYVFTDALLKKYDNRLIRHLVGLKEKRFARHESALRNVEGELARQISGHESALRNGEGEQARQIAHYESAMRDLNDELARQTALAQTAQQELLDAIAVSDERAEELEHYKSVLQVMHGSLSWRLTKPLRTLRTWMKR
ncbi:hypothetical protein AAIM60_15320 [Pseudomonas lijiangensis]|uniref:hypothetical protein n=1 Tax=Pseudomonas lijiangensis TaxID=2995658 RepID=UPI0031BA4ACB